MQAVELLYRQRPHLDYTEVLRRSREILESDLDSSDPALADKAFMIFHQEYSLEIQDGRIVATTALLSTGKPIAREAYQDAIQQSWRCSDAAELVNGCRESLLVCEMMAHFVEPPQRVAIFHGVLRAVIDATAPVALVFKHSQQVIAPAEYCATCDKNPIERAGSVNVRLFTIPDSGGTLIMDTRGLDEIGLHDLQCHFRQLEARDVAGVLYTTALYIFEHGPIIESGQTVEGIEAGSKWHCQFEESILEPKRTVLDLSPGQPYAAGNR